MTDDLSFQQSDVPLEEQSRFRRYLNTFILLLTVFVPCLVIVSIGNIFQEQVWFVPGGASHFDPIAQYDAVKNHAGNASTFIGFRVEGLRPDGTVDLNSEQSPIVVYEFYQAPDKLISVTLSRPFQFIREFRGASTDTNTYINLGMDRNSESSTRNFVQAPPPICPLGDFWAVTDQGSNSDASATVSYDVDGYSFRVDGTGTNLRFGNNCAVAN